MSSSLQVPLNWIIIFCISLLTIVLTMVLFLFFYKVQARLRANWRKKRKNHYESILTEWIGNQQIDCRQGLRWRFAGDRLILENLLIDIIRRFKGPLTQRAKLLAADLGLTAVNVNLAKKATSSIAQCIYLERLGLLGDERVAPFIETFLLSGRSELQFIAFRAMARIGAVSALPHLFHLIQKDSPIYIGRYASIIALFGVKAIPYLTGLIYSPEPKQRGLALNVLGQLHSLESLIHIHPLMLNEPDEQARLAAIRSVGAIRSPSSLPILMKVLSDPNETIRAQAVETLGQFRDPATITLLKNSLRDESWTVRYNAARNLPLAGRAGREILFQELEHVDADLSSLIRDIIKI